MYVRKTEIIYRKTCVSVTMTRYFATTQRRLSLEAPLAMLNYLTNVSISSLARSSYQRRHSSVVVKDVETQCVICYQFAINSFSPKTLSLLISGLSTLIWRASRHLAKTTCIFPDSKFHGANMGNTWVLSAPDGPHVGPMNLAIRVIILAPVIVDPECVIIWLIATNWISLTVPF